MMNQKILGKQEKCLFGHTTKHLSPENLENISNFEGWGLTLIAYFKKVYILFYTYWSSEKSCSFLVVIWCYIEKNYDLY